MPELDREPPIIKTRAKRMPGPGRPPGAPNKVPATVKDAFREAFELLGGAEGLARWAAARVTVNGRKVYPNLTAFYELATKLIPTESLSTGTVQHAHYITVEQREALPFDHSRIIEHEAVPVAVDPAIPAPVADFIG